MMKKILAASAFAVLLAGPVFAQDAAVTTCDQAAIDKLEADVMKQTTTNKDPAESPTAEKNDTVAQEVSSAKVAMGAGNMDECVMHINKAMEAMKQPG